MLQIENLRFGYASELLFEDASAVISTGQKVGFVGANGSGKSTLFRLIMGQLESEAGRIEVQPKATIGTVAQEAPSGRTPLIEAVIAGDTELARLRRRLADAPDEDAVQIHARLAERDGYSAEARAAALLSGLGFEDEEMKAPLDRFSGGWRMRVALAAVLFQEPDLLLLDEPSNYLDLEGTIWLRSFLKSYASTILFISHDKALLNDVATHILHLSRKRLKLYRGDYDRFARTKSEAALQREREQARLVARRKHLQSFVDRFRYKASKARQAQSRLKMIERLAIAPALGSERSPSFNFPEPAERAPPLVHLERVSVGYGEDIVLNRLDLRIDPDDRIALLGRNGAGKSTFARLLAGDLAPAGGQVTAAPKLRVGHFAQHQLDALRLGDSPYAHMEALMPREDETRVRSALGAFSIGEDLADRPVESLSGGEKARLVFALITREKPQILILDEPTNHLDIDAREALVAALIDYNGAILLISHDWNFVGALADRLWLTAGGTVAPFDGSLEDYEARLLGSGVVADAKTEKPSASPARTRRQAAAEKRAELAPLKRQVEAAETKLAAFGKKRDALRKRLENPALYEDSSDAAVAHLTGLQRRLSELEMEISDLEGMWLSAQEALEAARQEQDR